MTADAGSELQAIAEAVQTCTRCDLYRHASHGVPGEGPADARIMLVGEGPGRNEDKQGRPFVGAAGTFLEELLGIAGLSRSDVFITNVVKHWPNRDNGQFLENRAPDPGEIAACDIYLRQQLEIINPRLVLTLGRFSLAVFFPRESISRAHGQWRAHDGRFYFPMYHPAAALHQQALRNTLIADMRKLAAFLAGPEYQSAVSGAPTRVKSNPGAEPESPSEQLPLL